MLSFIRLADSPAAINQVRIDRASADALIAGDIVVSSSPKASATYRKGMRAVLSLSESPTGDIVRHRDASLNVDVRAQRIAEATGDIPRSIDANRLAETLLGDTVFANMLLLGFAWQAALVPVSLEALKRAIELNGVAVERNLQAIDWGRIAHSNPDALPTTATDTGETDETLDAIIDRRERFLTDYQNAAYAARYRALVDRVRGPRGGNRIGWID